MASVPNSSVVVVVAAALLQQKKSPFLQPSAVLGLSGMSKKIKVGKVRCGMDLDLEVEKKKGSSSAATALLAAASAASAAALSSPAMALVDERMSTEGVGLPFGLSNNLLGWILLGVFGLIWALYTVYTGSLDEDEDSGLSL